MNETTLTSGALVKVDKRRYRKIAQEHWGLTNEQMKRMHVHHCIPRSEGGTNDPSNLYVCSPWFHANVWHDGSYFIEQAAKGGAKGGKADTLKQRQANRQNGINVGKLPNSPKQIEAVKQTARENVRNGVLERARKISHERMSKPVLVTFIESGDTFEFNSVADAARGLNLDRQRVRQCCQGKLKQTKGFTATFIK